MKPGDRIAYLGPGEMLPLIKAGDEGVVVSCDRPGWVYVNFGGLLTVVAEKQVEVLPDE